MLLEVNLGLYSLLSNIIHFVFTVFLVSYMRFSIENSINSHSRFIFKRLMVFTIVCLLCDMLSYVFDMQTFVAAKFFNYVFTSASVFMTSFVGYYWNHFFSVIFHLNDDKKQSKKILFLSPVILISVFLFVNLFNGSLFYVDELNVYSRGPLAFVSFILQYLLFAVLIIRAIYMKRQKKGVRYSKLTATFIWIGVIALAFGLMQILGGGKIALHCFGLAAGVFIMFLRFQDEQITNDILTGLNNRYALDAYFEDKLKVYESGIWGRRRLYLIMMDINNFKRINDNYGHVEGDKALKLVAASLKSIANEYGNQLFIARYGGDEFCAVYETASEKKVIELCRLIRETLMKESDGYKYRIVMGAGYSVYIGKSMPLATLYESADKALYANKDFIKHGNNQI